MLPPLALVIAAATVLTALAATYQPVAYGSDSGPNLLPGLPQAEGARWVNTFGASSGDIYFPPQRGTFTASASFMNTGTHAVTIESASLQLSAQGLVPAGPVQYMLGGQQHPVVHVLRNVTLRPGDEIELGFPVRTGPCAERSAWTSLDHFVVRERFLFFTHTVYLPFTSDGGRLILHSPSHKGATDTFCVSQ